MGAVIAIRNQQPALHLPCPAQDNRSDTLTQTHRHAWGCAHYMPTYKLVANTYATLRQTPSIRCNGGLRALLEVSNMHERVEVCVS